MHFTRAVFSLQAGRHLAVTGTLAGAFVGLWFISGVLEKMGVFLIVKWVMLVVLTAVGVPLFVSICYDACFRSQEKGGNGRPLKALVDYTVQ